MVPNQGLLRPWIVAPSSSSSRLRIPFCSRKSPKRISPPGRSVPLRRRNSLSPRLLVQARQFSIEWDRRHAEPARRSKMSSSSPRLLWIEEDQDSEELLAERLGSELAGRYCL